MPYAIMRFAKRKLGSINSMEAHNERKKDAYKSNPDIDTNRCADNYHLVQPEKRYYAEIMSRIEQAGCRKRKDSVLMVETLITASPEFMNALPAEKQREYFVRALQFIKQEVREQNVIAATVHMDEKTPHMHICFSPITQDNRLSAKVVLGNQKRLSEWQTKFHEHMSAYWPELERGVSSMESHRKHIPLWLYKKAERMDKEFSRVRTALEDISIFNAGKKRDEALAVLEKWLPEAEKFSVQTKGIESYISELENTLQDKSKNIDYLNNRIQSAISEKDREIKSVWEKVFEFKQIADRQKRLLEKVPKKVLEEIGAKKINNRIR